MKGFLPLLFRCRLSLSEMRFYGSSRRIETAQVARLEKRRVRVGREAERWDRRWSRACSR